MSAHILGRRATRSPRSFRPASGLLGLAAALASGSVWANPPSPSADLAPHKGAAIYAIELIQSDLSTAIVGLADERFDAARLGLEARVTAHRDAGHLSATGTVSVAVEAQGLRVRAELRDGHVPKVGRIGFSGNKALSAQQLTEALAAQGNRRRGGQLAVGSRIDKATINGAIQRLTSTYFDAGYIGVQVKLVLDQADAKAPVGEVTFQIDEGAQFTLSKVEVGLADGSDLPPGFKVPPLFSKVDSPVSPEAMAQDDELLVLAARVAGFPNATATHAISLDNPAHRGAVKFEVTLGPGGASTPGGRTQPAGELGADKSSAAAPGDGEVLGPDAVAAVPAGEVQRVALDVSLPPPAAGADLPGRVVGTALALGLKRMRQRAGAPEVALVPGPDRPWGSADAAGAISSGARHEPSALAALTAGTTTVSTSAELRMTALAMPVPSFALGDVALLEVAAQVGEMRMGGTRAGKAMLGGPHPSLIWFSARSDGAPIGGLEILKGTLDGKGALVLSRHAVLTGSAPDEDPQTCAGAPEGALQSFGLWRDVAHDAAQPAVYIARAWLARTCAPAWRACVQVKGAAACGDQPEPRMLMPRAWTSPIWSGVASP